MDHPYQNRLDKKKEMWARQAALYIAMVVRNAMEDFHGKYLKDAQMAELNPIIRNAIYTALFATLLSDDPESVEFVKHNQRSIPSYWEPPQLLDSYPGSIEQDPRWSNPADANGQESN
jgi:hypothetical protein